VSVGFKPTRRHAFYKMLALVQGANVVRRELGLPESPSLGRQSEIFAAANSLVGSSHKAQRHNSIYHASHASRRRR
jgi:hypothetical protein